MKCFTLTVTEIFAKEIDIEADCIEDAIKEAFDIYGKAEIELEYEDIISMDIEETAKITKGQP